MLFVEVPAYKDTSVSHSVKVNFCVINGKRKRSQPQHFTYTPLAGTDPAQSLCCALSHLSIKIIIPAKKFENIVFFPGWVCVFVSNVSQICSNLASE